VPTLVDSTLVVSAPPALAPRRAPKILHLQILRAIAASLVVADHTLAAIDHFGVPSWQYHHAGGLMGHLGVTAFFVLSGLIMVRQSGGMFGVKGAPLLFASKRIIRIIPMYWIATLVWFFSPFHRLLPQAKTQLLLSLMFIPDFLSGKGRLEPVLGQGWTLNYEMAFYLLFSAALFLPRRLGIILLLVVPELLVALGHSQFAVADPASHFIFGFYTNDIITCFARGVLIGLFELEVESPFRLRLPISPAYLLLIPAAVFLAFPYRLGRFEVWDLLSFYSVLVVLACSLEVNERPGRISRFLVLLGDASYSTYLFHLLALPVVIPAGVWLWGHLPRTRFFTMLLLLAGVVAANVLGLLIHKGIERPLTGYLKKLKFSPLKTLKTQTSSGPLITAPAAAVPFRRTHRPRNCPP
jgi:exopolysaccharide production protein ExoZ